MVVNMPYGGGEGSLPELVWTNPDTSVAFTQTTVNESSSGWVSGKHYSDYDGFLVACSNYVSGSGASYASAVITYVSDDIDATLIDSIYKPCGTHYRDASHRDITMESNGILISSCIDSSNQNTYVIPIYIWGLRGKLSV